MERAGMAALRWLGAIVVLGVVVVVSLQQLMSGFQTAVVFGGDEPTESVTAAPTPEPEPSEPVTDGTAGPSADFVLQGATVAAAGTDWLELVPGRDLLVVAFPRIEGDPRCIEHVRLDAVVAADAPVEMGAWGSTIANAPELTDGAQVEQPVVLPGPPTAIAGTTGEEGWLPWNLTDLYREYVGSGQIPADAPFVVAIRAVSEDAPTVRVATSDAASDAQPRLTWLGVEGCGETEESPT